MYFRIAHNGVYVYVMPTEVEAALLGHPAIQDCIVWKTFHPELGDVLRAGIVAVKGTRPSKVNKMHLRDMKSAEAFISAT